MSTDLYRVFVENVHERLCELEMSQSDLAQALGVTTGYVSQLLGGHRRPGLKSLQDFAKVLEIEPCDLLRPLAKKIA